jgi:glutathione-regulated potassium-efflux system ancillary protein KefG
MASKKRIAILVFHPLLHKSRVNSVLLQAVEGLPEVNLRYMYDLYPDFHIDINEEQKVLVQHDIIVWQHPFYWYSAPSLLKEWLDLVLKHGFAYGKEGKALEGKTVMSAISTGGSRNTYGSAEGVKYSIRDLLAPFQLTVQLCRMRYLPPFVTHGTHLLKNEQIEEAATQYARIIKGLGEGVFPADELMKQTYINDLIA